jgi:hypothetical protein
VELKHIAPMISLLSICPLFANKKVRFSRDCSLKYSGTQMTDRYFAWNHFQYRDSSEIYGLLAWSRHFQGQGGFIRILSGSGAIRDDESSVSKPTSHYYHATNGKKSKEEVFWLTSEAEYQAVEERQNLSISVGNPCETGLQRPVSKISFFRLELPNDDA